MKLYKKLITVFLSFIITYSINAQEGSLSGSLMDQNEESIPFATVAVMKLPDSTVVTGSTTEMDGSFNLKSPENGKYVLRFSAIGFESIFTPLFEIASSDYRKDFGLLTMQEELTMLNEVMIQTWRPRVKVENGKMVMKVEGTAVAAGKTAYEMLSRAPGVSVGQDGEFMINGKSGVNVMLDGRMTYLSAKELQTLLESMPAENIEEIEVIHNPSAKYDAEGTAGILNISLKKNTNTGLSGSVYGGYKVNNQRLFNGGVNLNHSAGRWNSYASLDLSEGGRYRPQKVTRTFPGNENFTTYKQNGIDIKEEFTPSLRIGTDHEMSKNHEIGVMANLIYKNIDADWNTYTALTHPVNGTYVNVEALNHRDEQFYNGQFNLHYTGKLDTVGTTISADVDYIRLENEESFDFRNTYSYPADGSTRLELLDNISLSDYSIYAAKVDFSTPLSVSSSLGLGVKASKVESDSDLKYFVTEDNERNLDPSNSDRFRYEEEIYSAYVEYSNRFNDTWNLQAGLRAEQTYGKGRSFTMNETNKRDYLEFFPNLMLEQKVSDNYQLNYSYSRRILRPDYSTFNPTIFYLDPYTYTEGNPDLQAQITDSFKMTHTFFKRFNLLLSYDSTNNHFIEVPAADAETGKTSFTSRNLDNFSSYGATLVAPVELAKFWNVNNTVVFNQHTYDLTIDGTSVENDNLFYLFQSNHQVNLPWDIKLEVNGTYRGPMAYGVYNIEKQFWVDAGLKKSFLNDKLDVTLNATDIFKGMEMNVTADYLGNTIEIDQYFDHRAVSLNLRYSFNPSNSKQQSRKNELEELNRAGGS
ncbi:outer membrane beta-barrel family protein [Salinimicrobium xinjiangense]|uniref:outer membrane beta-barrel family protein n=1 Tax=Salinimicrobium xinjiangense TaxID=438596 RepID=UPI0004007593|nr:outer membrane beta-barrel family protein [Salinimicrobium xinjiangense]